MPETKGAKLGMQIQELEDIPDFADGLQEEEGEIMNFLSQHLEVEKKSESGE